MAAPSDPAADSTEVFSVKRYTPDHRQEWDAFIRNAKNTTFLFYRDYMDYHSNRFADHSLMVFRGEKLAALLPANLNADGTLISHEGLTYGGLVVRLTATLWEVLACFHAALLHLNQEKISRLFYKQLPVFYNPVPGDEVTFALFLLDAQLYRRDCAMVVPQAGRLRFRKGRKSEFSKARRFGVRLAQETDFAPFWKRILVPRLAARYGISPVHTVDEITLLASRFPEHIKQFLAYFDNEVVAGTTIYETPGVAHAQYLGVSDKGRKIGALDYLFDWLIEVRYNDKRYFDFGICNESGGRGLNHGMVEWKEGFGARCYAHDFYEIATKNYPKLEPVLQDKLKHDLLIKHAQTQKSKHVPY